MKKNFVLFVIALTMIFGFITLLQFVNGLVFAGALVLMHCGVVLYIISKKRFKKLGCDIKRHYTLENALMALYIPVLAAKVLSALDVISFDEEIKKVIVICISAACVVVSIVNCIIMYKRVCKIN